MHELFKEAGKHTKGETSSSFKGQIKGMPNAGLQISAIDFENKIFKIGSISDKKGSCKWSGLNRNFPE